MSRAIHQLRIALAASVAGLLMSAAAAAALVSTASVTITPTPVSFPKVYTATGGCSEGSSMYIKFRWTTNMPHSTGVRVVSADGSIQYGIYVDIAAHDTGDHVMPLCPNRGFKFRLRIYSQYGTQSGNFAVTY